MIDAIIARAEVREMRKRMREGKRGEFVEMWWSLENADWGMGVMTMPDSGDGGRHRLVWTRHEENPG